MAPQASSKRSAIASRKHRCGRKRSAVTNLCRTANALHRLHRVDNRQIVEMSLILATVRELMDQFNEEGPRAEIYVKRTINGMIGDDYLAETTNADGEKTVSPTQKLDQLLDDIEASTEFQELLAIASEEERYIQTCLFFKSRLTVQRRTLSQLHELWMTERRLREEYEIRFGVLQPRENRAVQTEPNERDIAVGPSTVHAAPPNTSASHGASYDETMEYVPMNDLNNATYYAHDSATVGTSSNQPAIPVTPMRPNAHGTTPFPYPSPKSMPRARRRLATPIPQTDPDDDNEYEDDGIYMDVDERPDPGPSSVGGDRSTSRTPARDDVEARLQAAMADKTEEIRRKDLQITQKDALLTQKDMQLAQKDRQLVELDTFLFERDNMLAQRNVDVALLQGQVTASRDRLERQLEENEVEQMILLRTIEKEQDEKEQLKQRYKEEILGIQAMNDQFSLALRHLQSGL